MGKYGSVALSVWAAANAVFGSDPPPVTESTATSAPAATPGARVAGPTIRFDSLVFDFGRVMTGETVKHDFYFTNTGSQALVLTAVQPQCGCTTAGEWTRQVKPGAAGVIPLQFNTINYDTAVTKTIHVACNDPVAPSVSLQLKGVVWKAIEIYPTTVMLRLLSKAPLATATVRITNTLDQPLLLCEPECANPMFGARLQTNYPGREYFVFVSNTVALPAREMPAQITTLTLRTSLTNMPVLSLTAYAQVTPDLSVFPRQIMLPPAPIPANQLDRYIVVVNNSTNPITISDMAISSKDPRVSAQLRQDAAQFNITLSFPPDFAATPGEPLFFTAKTSDPEFPEIKLPIHQSALPEPQVQTPARARRKSPADALSTNSPRTH